MDKSETSIVYYSGKEVKNTKENEETFLMNTLHVQLKERCLVPYSRKPVIKSKKSGDSFEIK
ncbi:MAG: hypothetical protein ACI8ZB_003637 [Desulforhopalus sp.]|jgi:hypothetical protein